MPALYLFVFIFITAALDGCNSVPTQARLPPEEAADSFRRANILEKYEGKDAADVLSRHPYRDDAPLIRLRRSSLSGKVRYTIGITDTGNLEFFGCKNYKCSDELGAALWAAIVPDAVHLIGHYTDAYMSEFKRSDEYHLRLILDKDADK